MCYIKRGSPKIFGQTREKKDNRERASNVGPQNDKEDRRER
jgi:hypothetical protein